MISEKPVREAGFAKAVQFRYNARGVSEVERRDLPGPRVGGRSSNARTHAGKVEWEKGESMTQTPSRNRFESGKAASATRGPL